jgi:hypothetical protein
MLFTWPSVITYLYKKVQDKGENEGFMLEEDFADAVLPEMTVEVKSSLSKVRKLFKFFRNLNVTKFAN